MIGYLDKMYQISKIANLIIRRLTDKIIDQLKIQVSSCKFTEGKDGFDKSNSYNSFPLAFTFSRDRVEKIVKDGFPFPRE